jgi:hypothetical protein
MDNYTRVVNRLYRDIVRRAKFEVPSDFDTIASLLKDIKSRGILSNGFGDIESILSHHEWIQCPESGMRAAYFKYCKINKRSQLKTLAVDLNSHGFKTDMMKNSENVVIISSLGNETINDLERTLEHVRQSVSFDVVRLVRCWLPVPGSPCKSFGLGAGCRTSI